MSAFLFFRVPISTLGKVGMVMVVMGTFVYNNESWRFVTSLVTGGDGGCSRTRTYRRHIAFLLVSTIVVVASLRPQRPQPVESKRQRTESSVKSCNVIFKDGNMALCHFLAYGCNFGDEIGIAVAKELLKKRFECQSIQVPVIDIASQSRDGKTCLFNLGSIHHLIQSNDHVWGTGINPKWQRKGVVSNVTYHAVRGALTRQWIEDHNSVSGLPIGDPGSAAIHLFDPEFKATSKSDAKPCFVPHHQDQELFLSDQQNYAELSQIHMISVRNTWKNVTRLLSTCSSIASSSLHGLVIADALDISNRWFQYSGGKTEETEGYFKYQDYFSTIQRSDSKPMNDIHDLLNTSNYWSPPEPSIMQSLIFQIESSFPYALFSTVEVN